MFMTELRCKIGLRSAEKVPKSVNRKQVGNKNGDIIDFAGITVSVQEAADAGKF